MGSCCSTNAKGTGASSSRHFVAVSSSPSLLPTEKESGQDSAVASHVEEMCSYLEKALETASVVNFKEKCSISRFIETGVDPTSEAKHRLREKKDSLESLLNKPRGNKEWSEESFTENEDEGNNVIALKPCSSGAIRRLKKKDSIRQPNYKDDIMLNDNIDSIVEREIPEVPMEITSLAKDIKFILNDDLPAAESNRICLIGSNSPRFSVTSRLSAETNKKKADNSLAEDIDYILNDDMPPVESNGQCSPSSDVIPRSSAKRNMDKKADSKLERDIQNIVSDGKPDAKSNGISPFIAGAAPGPKAIHAKRKNKKMDDKEKVLEVVLRLL